MQIYKYVLTCCNDRKSYTSARSTRSEILLFTNERKIKKNVYLLQFTTAHSEIRSVGIRYDPGDKHNHINYTIKNQYKLRWVGISLFTIINYWSMDYIMFERYKHNNHSRTFNRQGHRVPSLQKHLMTKYQISTYINIFCRLLLA